MLVLIALIAPTATGILALGIPWRPWIGWAAATGNLVVMIAGIFLATRVTGHHAISAIDGIARVDALSAFMIILIGAIAFLAGLQSVRYLTASGAKNPPTGASASRYCALVQLFVLCMLAAVLAANLGTMWVAIEATTVTTTFLVGHSRHRRALEASWKYVVICSVGIALALLGTILIYFAALHPTGTIAVGDAATSHANLLDWTSLVALSAHLNHSVLRLAFMFIVLGYGTKVGLAPLYSWLPDAHSEAPAPVSALMSGVLLSVALYALLRIKTIVDGSLGVGFSRTLLVIVGLASLAIVASLMLTQTNYKRMLAYSSIEHMGLIALGAAAGSSLAIAAVLLHIFGHGLIKTVLFLSAGEILIVEGSSDIDEVSALLARRPALGGIFSVGILAIGGLPPFSLFISELTMVRAEIGVGLAWAAAASLLCVAIIFTSMMGHGRRMLLGSRVEEGRRPAPSFTVTVPLFAGLGACAFIGIFAWPLMPLLHAAARVVSP